MNEKLLQLVTECVAAANDGASFDFERADFFLRAAFHEDGTVTWFASLGGAHAAFGSTDAVAVTALTRQIRSQKDAMR